MSTWVNHMPWDKGVITDAFAGLVGTPKTTKTMCGKRVKIPFANHRAAISCLDCHAEMEREQQFINYIKDNLEHKEEADRP